MLPARAEEDVMYEPAIAQVGPMHEPDIPGPPTRWVIQFWDGRQWDWNMTKFASRRDELLAECRERRQWHQLATIHGVESDE